jgi:hypothetical protein
MAAKYLEGGSMATQVVLRGTVTSDGTLELAGPVGLAPGPVEVWVTPAKPATQEDLTALLARIRAEQKARGHVPRTAEEIDEDVRQMRDEAENEMRAIERMHEESRRPRSATAEGETSP